MPPEEPKSPQGWGEPTSRPQPFARYYERSEDPEPGPPPAPPGPPEADPVEEPEPADEPGQPKAEPTLAIYIASHVPSSVYPGRVAVMESPEILCRAAVGTLVVLRAMAMARPFAGGYDFTAKEVWEADPPLRKSFATANTPGTYLGVGLVVGSALVQPGLRLRRTNGHSPFRYSPSSENRDAALAALSAASWPHQRIADEVGAPDPGTLAADLYGLWSHSRYLSTYRRGRRPATRKTGR